MAELPGPSPLRTSRPTLFKRRFRVSHMDFEHAIWELGTLLVMPRQVYRNVFYNKQTKNTWARDDPAILVLMISLLILSSIAWSIIRAMGIWSTILLCLKMLFRDFLLVAALSATVIWVLANAVMSSSGDRVEWAYAFDLHCNGFFALFSWLYILQLFLLPIVTGPRFPSLLVGNLLYLFGLVQYLYIVYLGLSALPFLRRTNLVLLPLLPALIFFVISLAGLNLPRLVLQIYFD